MSSLVAALPPYELTGHPELAARLNRQGEVLAGWLVAVGLLIALVVL